MGASGENGRKNPTRSGRTKPPLQIASSCSRAGLYSVVSVTAVANRSFLCTRTDHVGEPERFSAMLRAKVEDLRVG